MLVLNNAPTSTQLGWMRAKGCFAMEPLATQTRASPLPDSDLALCTTPTPMASRSTATLHAGSTGNELQDEQRASVGLSLALRMASSPASPYVPATASKDTPGAPHLGASSLHRSVSLSSLATGSATMLMRATSPASPATAAPPSPQTHPHHRDALPPPSPPAAPSPSTSTTLPAGSLTAATLPVVPMSPLPVPYSRASPHATARPPALPSRGAPPQPAPDLPLRPDSAEACAVVTATVDSTQPRAERRQTAGTVSTAGPTPLTSASSSSSASLRRASSRKRRQVTGLMPGRVGLRNLGNTCYVNSVIQALSAIPLFRDFFLYTFVPTFRLVSTGHLSLSKSPWHEAGAQALRQHAPRTSRRSRTATSTYGTPASRRSKSATTASGTGVSSSHSETTKSESPPDSALCSPPPVLARQTTVTVYEEVKKKRTKSQRQTEAWSICVEVRLCSHSRRRQTCSHP